MVCDPWANSFAWGVGLGEFDVAVRRDAQIVECRSAERKVHFAIPVLIGFEQVASQVVRQDVLQVETGVMVKVTQLSEAGICSAMVTVQAGLNSWIICLSLSDVLRAQRRKNMDLQALL